MACCRSSPSRFGLALLTLISAQSWAVSAQEAQPIRLVQRTEDCLSRREAIAAVQGKQAVPLGQVRGVAEAAGRGEMINAELCRDGGRLHYVVTLLGAGGRVVKARVDAETGRLLGLR